MSKTNPQGRSTPFTGLYYISAMQRRARWLAGMTAILITGAAVCWWVRQRKSPLAEPSTAPPQPVPATAPPVVRVVPAPAPMQSHPLQNAPLTAPTPPPPVIAPARQPPWPYEAPPPPGEWATLSAGQRLGDVRGRLLPGLEMELSSRGFNLGDNAFIRIFKETNELELWLRTGAEEGFRLYRNYHIAFYSGTLGPKTKEGDMQAPEGFYAFGRSQLNPASRYHLSFNIGYPNEFDLSLKRTGSLIMVHGSDVSIGCFAMTDPVIEEIYLIAEAALNGGQGSVPVHVFPFRMTGERMENARMAHDPWLGFWENLKEGHDRFEASHRPPQVSTGQGRYVFSHES